MYVSNLGFHVTDEDLKGLFLEFGEVTSAKVITDKVTGKSRGFGFVEMSVDSAAEEVVISPYPRQSLRRITTTVLFQAIVIPGSKQR